MATYGNRLPVPKPVKSKHFLYLAKLPALNADHAETLTKAVLDFARREELRPGQIEVMSARDLVRHGYPAAAEALELIEEAHEARGLPKASGASVLFCEWAALHEDSSFEGVAFFSTVLHTGPHPYVIQTVATPQASKENGGGMRVETSTKTLEPGDHLVFDPTTPHYAVPLRPHQDQLLVLLQMELSDEDAAERAALVKALPPRADDSENQERLEHIS